MVCGESCTPSPAPWYHPAGSLRQCGHDNNGILQAKRSAYSIPLLIYWLHLCEIKSTQRLIGKELNN